MVEGANINKSLLSLGNCITLLYQNRVDKTNQYIPYRKSKLTKLLKNSLGGNSRTVIIANVSLPNSNYNETCDTLEFASKARNIKTDVKRSFQNEPFNFRELQSVISNLKSENTELKDELNKQKMRVSRSKSPMNYHHMEVGDQSESEIEQNVHEEYVKHVIYFKFNFYSES
jgi:kinesin family protein 18/19